MKDLPCCKARVAPHRGGALPFIGARRRILRHLGYLFRTNVLHRAFFALFFGCARAFARDTVGVQLLFVQEESSRGRGDMRLGGGDRRAHCDARVCAFETHFSAHGGSALLHSGGFCRRCASFCVLTQVRQAYAQGGGSRDVRRIPHRHPCRTFRSETSLFQFRRGGVRRGRGISDMLEHFHRLRRICGSGRRQIL